MTALVVGIGVLRATPPPPPPVDPLATRLASVDTSTMTVRRAGFCSALPDATVAAALGGRVVTRSAWRPGDRTQPTPQVQDIVDEYGCSWSTASGAEARAWVFAAPVTPQWAGDLVRMAPQAGCHPVATAPFGAPASALSCGSTTVLRGLFGDAWLSCALTSHDLDLVGRWCVAVARAAG